MPRTRRWNEVVHGFSAGILSPASQDTIDNENWLAGAARLDNFTVERDGGVSGRPAFGRGDVVLQKPRYGLLAYQADLQDPNVHEGWNWSVGPVRAWLMNVSGGRVPDDLYDSPGGIAPIGRFEDDGRFHPLKIQVTTVINLLDNLFRIELSSGRPRAITFHGIYLTQGSWSGEDSDQVRANLKVVGHKRGDPARTVIEYQDTPASDEDQTPFDRGVLAVGKIPRDITIRLDLREETRGLDLDWIAIRFNRTGAASLTEPFELVLSGVSCFSVEPPDTRPFPVELGEHVFDAPWRIIPWSIREESYVLVLGMTFATMYEVRPGQSPSRRQGDDPGLPRGGVVWHFTERQLRELTWATYGGNLLLCHPDFIHPLEVQLPRGGMPFRITPLALENMPVLGAATLARIAPRLADQPAILGNLLPGTTELQVPSGLTLVGRQQAFTATWLTTGAPSYQLRYGLKSVYDAQVAANMPWTQGNIVDVVPVLDADIINGRVGPVSPHPLVNGIEHAVAVRSTSVDQQGNTIVSGWSEPAFVTPMALLAKPVVTARAGSVAGVIELDWPDVPGAERYRRQFRVPGARIWSSAGLLLGAGGVPSSWTFTGVSGTTYEFRVRAAMFVTGSPQDLRIHDIAYSDWSDTVTFTAP